MLYYLIILLMIFGRTLLDKRLLVALHSIFKGFISGFVADALSKLPWVAEHDYRREILNRVC